MQPGLPKIFLLSISETQVQESILDDSWMYRLSDGDGEGLSMCVRVALICYPLTKRLSVPMVIVHS